jgi:diaminopimelate epimerase
LVPVGKRGAPASSGPTLLISAGSPCTTACGFPTETGTNVQVARVESPGHVRARVWERGVGETSSSGTGAVAVAAATYGEGEVVVSFPGGDLRVRLAGGRAFLTGPAERLE